jgi:hypothetical protein
MAGIEVKNERSADETRPLADKGHVAVVTVLGHPVPMGEFKPGWRWSEHLKPVAGTDSCQATHLIYCISNRMHVVMDGGTEADVGPGDVVAIEPGHDAWVVGDESFLSVDFGGYAQYAKVASASS